MALGAKANPQRRESMKKMFAVVLLVAVAGCGGKKASTTPTDKTSQEMKDGATGGAAYGGAAYGGHKSAAPAGKGAANPCTNH